MFRLLLTMLRSPNPVALILVVLLSSVAVDSVLGRAGTKCKHYASRIANYETCKKYYECDFDLVFKEKECPRGAVFDDGEFLHLKP